LGRSLEEGGKRERETEVKEGRERFQVRLTRPKKSRELLLDSSGKVDGDDEGEGEEVGRVGFEKSGDVL